MSLDVCICTHDPRPGILELTVRSLARQTARTFNVLVVDNASAPPIAEAVLAPLHGSGISAARSREEQRGLVLARLHAIRATRGEWMLFLDDDNELADDFVEEGLRFIASRNDVGCFGGKLLLPAGLKTPRWALPFLPYLAIKDAGNEVITGTGERWGPWEPPGAGVFVRRDVAEAYRSRVEGDPRALELGRSGRGGLASCEDSLMVRQSFGLGALNAYVPRLALRHHLDSSRLQVGYLVRLMRAYGESQVLLESLLRPEGAPLWTPGQYRSAHRFLRLLLSEANSARKESIPFALGKLAYHWSARRAYLGQERGDS